MTEILEPRTRGRKSDRKFFLRFPHRQHRLRPAFRGEAETVGIKPASDGLRLFALCRLVPDIAIMRVFLPSPPGFDLDAVTEADASALFDFCIAHMADGAKLVIEREHMPMHGRAE